MSSQVKYQVWIVGDEDEDDDHWTMMEYPGWESFVAERFLQHAHSNMDGWEWMRNDNGKSIVRVKQEGAENWKRVFRETAKRYLEPQWLSHCRFEVTRNDKTN